MIIVQKPNLPLVAALTGLAFGKLTGGVSQVAGNTLYTVAIIIWALLEITSGANMFRRLLGVIVIAYTVYSLF